MRNRAFLSTLTAFVMAAFVVDAAQAATKTWQASGGVMGGSWNDPAHWSGGVPTPGSDDVVFPANSISAGTQYTVTVNVSNAEVQFMDVHSDCNLDLNSNTFKVGTADGQTSNIAAQILLANASENLQFNFSHTLAPKTINGSPVYGTISGQNNSAQIRIGNGKQLTNQIVIEGALQIVPVSGSSYFQNDGSGAIVRANFSGGVLEVSPGNDLVAGSGRFQVTSSNATLRFSDGYTAMPPSSMTGQITVSAGTLDIQAGFYSAGQLSFTGGLIQVAAGLSFKASQ